jgi:hypothetical protein
MVAIFNGTVYNRCMDDYKSQESLGTSKERMELIMEIQPKDTSRGHFYVSLAKSALRIVAGGNLLLGNLFWAGALLILAEVLGIVEELV